MKKYLLILGLISCSSFLHPIEITSQPVSLKRQAAKKIAKSLIEEPSIDKAMKEYKMFPAQLKPNVAAEIIAKTLILEDLVNQQYQQLTGHTEGISSVAFSPDGRYVVSGSDDGTLILWKLYPDDIKQAILILRLKHGDLPAVSSVEVDRI